MTVRRLLPALFALVLFAVVLLAAACGDDSGSTQDDDQNFNPGVDGTEDALPDGTVVFDPDEVESDSYGEPTTWTPAVDDIEEAEAALQDHLAEEADLGLDPFDSYHRQYVGIGDGEDVVSVNALCEGSGLEDWEDQFIVVADGGTCFWQAHVDLGTGEVDPLTVNGEA